MSASWLARGSSGSFRLARGSNGSFMAAVVVTLSLFGGGLVGMRGGTCGGIWITPSGIGGGSTCSMANLVLLSISRSAWPSQKVASSRSRSMMCTYVSRAMRRFGKDEGWK